MSRLLFALAVAGLALAPDRAAAFGGRSLYAGPPVVFVPAYYVPVYNIVPYPVCPVPCCPSGVAAPSPAPAPAAPLQPPRVQQVPSGSSGGLLPKESGPKLSVAEPPPPAKDFSPAGVAVPRAADPTPKEAIAPPKRTDEPLQLPRPTNPAAESPVVPKLDAPSPPPAPPAAVVPKDPAEVPKIPVPNVPIDPDASRFPPLKLSVPTEGSSESRSSPLTNERRAPRVEVIPVQGLAPADVLLTVGFHNRTDRDVTLTVQGETVRLPGRHSVTARVPTGFTWRLDGGVDRTADLPAGSPGAEVVIRK